MVTELLGEILVKAIMWSIAEEGIEHAVLA